MEPKVPTVSYSGPGPRVTGYLSSPLSITGLQATGQAKQALCFFKMVSVMIAPPMASLI